MNEHEKILDLVSKALAKIQYLSEPEPSHQAYEELWAAARWIAKLEPEEKVSVSTAILAMGEVAQMVWPTFLVEALAKVEAEIDEIKQGVSYFDPEIQQTMMVQPVVSDG